VCRVGGGPATTVLAYGTEIEVAGTQAVLAHPAAPSALETLRAWRTATARSIGKPPYVVFDDRTLVHLAARLPVTDVGLLSVPGIGQVKLDSYGADLVEITEAARSA
jgi:superfamily II DNA helicase RecQ